MLECTTGHWTRETTVRLKHQPSNHVRVHGGCRMLTPSQYLFSTGTHAYNGAGVSGQQEAAATPGTGRGTAWRAVEGFFPKTKGA